MGELKFLGKTEKYHIGVFKRLADGKLVIDATPFIVDMGHWTLDADVPQQDRFYNKADCTRVYDEVVGNDILFAEGKKYKIEISKKA